jgi:hypothetical protein
MRLHLLAAFVVVSACGNVGDPAVDTARVPIEAMQGQYSLVYCFQPAAGSMPDVLYSPACALTGGQGVIGASLTLEDGDATWTIATVASPFSRTGAATTTSTGTFARHRDTVTVIIPGASPLTFIWDSDDEELRWLMDGPTPSARLRKPAPVPTQGLYVLTDCGRRYDEDSYLMFFTFQTSRVCPDGGSIHTGYTIDSVTVDIRADGTATFNKWGKFSGSNGSGEANYALTGIYAMVGDTLVITEANQPSFPATQRFAWDRKEGFTWVSSSFLDVYLRPKP